MGQATKSPGRYHSGSVNDDVTLLGNSSILESGTRCKLCTARLIAPEVGRPLIISSPTVPRNTLVLQAASSLN